ncbi:MAG: peptidase M30, hyicolysin, partial [Thermotogae bacterium]|nr:peptidase M30, hyicolysin [Thermotogota bacterium]
YLLVSNESTDGNFDQYSGTLSVQSIDQKQLDQPEGMYWYEPHLPLPKDLSLEKLVNPSIVKKTLMNIGDTKDFWVDDISHGGRYQITATLQAIGNYCEIWVEDPNEIDQTKAQQLASEFDNIIYPAVTTYFYEPSDVNGDGKVTILCFDIQDGFSGSGGYVAGYFYAYDLYNFYDSNKMEIFYIDTYPTMHYPITDPVDVSRAYSTLAHEFQHMVSYNRNVLVEGNSSMDTWIDEGLSMAAEHMIYGVLNSRIYYFNNSSSIANGHSLLYWDYSGDTLSNYALSYLFLQYVRTQMGQGDSIFREILMDSNNNYKAIEDAIHNYLDSDLNFGRFMTYFRIALLLKENSGYYGFKGDADFDGVDPPLYTGTGENLRGGGALLKAISDSFTDPNDQGPDICYAGITK